MFKVPFLLDVFTCMNSEFFPKVTASYLAICVASYIVRLVPIMLLKLPIMVWSNAPEFCLLSSIYAPYVQQFALQIQCFISLMPLKL